MSSFFVDQLTLFNTAVYNFREDHEDVNPLTDRIIRFYTMRLEDYDPVNFVNYHDNMRDLLSFEGDVKDFWKLYIWSKYHELREVDQYAYDEFAKKYPDFFNKQYWTGSIYEDEFLVNPADYEEEERIVKNSNDWGSDGLCFDDDIDSDDFDEPQNNYISIGNTFYVVNDKHIDYFKYKKSVKRTYNEFEGTA